MKPIALALSVLLSLLTPPLAVESAEQAKAYRIGVLLSTGPVSTRRVGAAAQFLEGLRELGYVEEKNIIESCLLRPRWYGTWPFRLSQEASSIATRPPESWLAEPIPAEASAR
jgi:hypothetical protein